MRISALLVAGFGPSLIILHNASVCKVVSDALWSITNCHVLKIDSAGASDQQVVESARLLLCLNLSTTPSHNLSINLSSDSLRVSGDDSSCCLVRAAVGASSVVMYSCW